MEFNNGLAIIRKKGKIVAKCYDRAIYYPLMGIKSQFSSQYPYSIEIKGIGSRECETVEECETFINKYT